MNGIDAFIDQVDDNIEVINAADWLVKEPLTPDQVLEDTLDIGDKMVVIGSSKQRKSFFFQQLAIALASGRDFLNWRVPKPRKVLYIQYEIRPAHQHRRVFRMAPAMGITTDDIGDRLQFISARGKKDMVGRTGIERIKRKAKKFGSEVIMIDPLYKISEGAENLAEDFKTILAAFDEMAEETGAAIIFVHHDKKGNPGDSANIDRGAGSGILARDYDASIILTPHSREADTSVVEVLVRNYAPQENFVIQWYAGEGGCRFNLAEDVAAEKQTSRTKTPPPPYESYLPTAAAILVAGKEMDISLFKALFKEKAKIGRDRVNDFVTWATKSTNPAMTTREERGRGKNQ
jgi:RecA-family ATPase